MSKRHKAFVTEFFQYRVQIILGGLKEGEEGQAETSQYLNYIARLYQSQEPLSQAEQFAQGYHDFLQAPLQPLQDDLGSQTYTYVQNKSDKTKNKFKIKNQKLKVRNENET